MKKILIVTSSYQFVRSFLIPHIEYWVRNGWIVDVASDDDGQSIPHVRRKIDIPVKRTPFHSSNITAIKQLSQHLDNEQYDIINCHTPIGAMIARLAAGKARRKGAKVVYMAHGYHFYKGAPWLNWMLYYTAEKLLAHKTDAIITINEEDCLNASRYFPEIPRQYYLTGIGYDESHVGVSNEEVQRRLRAQYNLCEEDFVCIYMARYARHKKQAFLIKALAEAKKHIPNCKLMLLGEGEEMNTCRQLAQELNVADAVIFAGYQPHISGYMHIADVGVSASAMEGLPINIVEEMSIALPILASDIRGHNDLIVDGKNGLLYTLDDKADFVKKLVYLYEHPEERKQMGAMAQMNISKYSAESVVPQLADIFEKILS